MRYYLKFIEMYYRLISTIFFGFVLMGTAIAQNFALVEHFTNTHCPICSRKNPQLYQVIEANATNVHHIAYHPPYPYDACIFYNANIEGNQTRADFYNVPGSPTAYVNGARGNAGSDLLSSDKVTTAISQPLMFEMQVTEATTGSSHEVDISLKTLINPPTGTYKLFAAVVEKEIDYNSPNGESTHHDVFRKMLPSNDGETLTLPAPGNEVDFNYSFQYESGWQQNQIYVVVFIQNIDDKTVVGSATKFDQTTTSIKTSLDFGELGIRTNPVGNQLTLDVQNTIPSNTELIITDLSGSELITTKVTEQKHIYQIDVQNLSAGTFVLQLKHPRYRVKSLKFLKL